MPDEVTPDEPVLGAASPALPDVENLADSDDANVITARAKLLEAQAKLTKASTPLIDKIVLRGLLPIALAIVGPWALWKFDASQVEQKKQGEVIVELQTLLGDQKKEMVIRRERFQQIEEKKAAELAAMSNMVIRLDDMLKTALVRMAVSRSLGPAPRGPGARPVSLPERDAVVRDAIEQITLPGLEEEEVKRIAEQQYDRMSEQRRR